MVLVLMHFFGRVRRVIPSSLSDQIYYNFGYITKHPVNIAKALAST